MLNQGTQVEDSSKQHQQLLSISNPNPLNDHDYCSPNKRVASKSQDLDRPSSRETQRCSRINSPNTSSAQASNKLVQPPTDSHKTPTSSSSSPNPQKSSEDGRSISTVKKEFSNENLSDSSSSSSSLSSSFASTKELFIAQESDKQKGRLIPPKNTPSVSKNKQARLSTKALENSGDDQIESGRQIRAKRVRQSTSVTDKSEWIMGDDQIDSVLSEHLGEAKERKHKDNGSASNQYTSSDYSSSDAESDQESDYNSENDPDRLWCICRKPHGDKFMICCDICKEWFHGHCVGVTKLMGDRFEKEGKEWFCGDCQEKLRSGIPRNAIPNKSVKKEKKKKASLLTKRGRGRPKKTETTVREGLPTRVSHRTTRKSSSSLDPKLGVDNGRLRKNLSRSDARSESFAEFEDSQRLKELIKERKKEFFYKRHLAEQKTAAKRSELGLGRHSLTANLSDSLDSLATSTSTPNMNNLPINIKSEHKERSKPNIVLQINTKKDSSNDQANSSSRLVTTIVRSKKSRHADLTDVVVDDLFTAEPIQISKKAKNTLTTLSAATHDTSSSNGGGGKRSNSSSSSKNEKSPDSADQGTPRKKRKPIETTAPNGSSGPPGSNHIAQKIKESLEARSKQMKDLEVSNENIEKLATEIEGQLNECFKEGTQKYLNKFRSLIFNLRDLKNQGLVKNVLSGEISPARLVRMSPDEMASHELAKWRERENKHSIELIKRDAQLAAQQVIVKKTHKGEEVISARLMNEPDDPTAEVDNQEPPITPTKLTVKSEGSKLALAPSPTSGPLKMKITGISSDPTLKTSEGTGASSSSCDDSLPFLDTTKEHKNHVFDMNCKICTNKTDVSEPTIKHDSTRVRQERKISESEQQSDQPKRLRVSIDTKLDPANLSRLKEPLIKPTQPAPASSDEYSPSRLTPNELSLNPANEDEETAYDLEKNVSSTEPKLVLEPTTSHNEPCWSGSVTMPDISKFHAMAKPVSGVLDFMKEEINQNLMVCGRIAPDQVQGYIKKLKTTTKIQILIIQLFPLNQDDKSNFNTFFDYLYSRNRYGVIQTSPQILKDFYVLPIHEKSSIPEVLKPLRSQALDRKDPNCLIGLLVRSKRTTSSNASYTPKPIK